MVALAELRAVLRVAASKRNAPARVSFTPAALEPFLAAIRARQQHYELHTPEGQWRLADVSRELAHMLPSAARRSIGAIYDAGSSPCVLIRGLPLPDAAPPVFSPLLHELDAHAAQTLLPTLAVHAAVGACAGVQYTFLEERGENAFHLVMPAPHVPAGTQSSVGASAVNFHTEDPIAPIDVYQPRALCLSMVRPQPGVQTALTPVDAMAEDLLGTEALLLPTLAASRFRHPAPDVVRIMGGHRAREVEGAYDSAEGRPVLYVRRRADEPAGAPTAHAALILVEQTEPLDPTDAEARVALVALRRLLARHAARFELAAGELLCWANQRVAHGRTGALQPQYGGRDRLLIRSFHHPTPPPTRVVRSLAAV